MTIDANGFDRDFYLARNSDVAAAGVDPYVHYSTTGWREGRNPNPIFDVAFYLTSNPDVAAAKVDPLAHFMNVGWKEGRDPSIAFDVSDYLMANSDVAAAHINPLTHYLLYGQAEHRALALDYWGELNEGFDRAYYLASNPDVASNGLDPYIHYQLYGNAEGRSPNALFDKAFYLAHNPDVAAAHIDPFQHFLKFGWREGRDPSANFSLAEYRAATGTAASENPLIRYLSIDRYSSLPSDLREANPPHVLQSRGQPLSAVLVGEVRFQFDGALTHVSAPASPLHGHDLSGFTSYLLSDSTADFAILGAGRLPTYIALGSGDDRVEGVFNLGGQILNLSSGAGTLSVNAQFDNGNVAILGSGSSGSSVATRGGAAVHFTGGAGADSVTLGAGDDSLLGGGGANYLDGGLGADVAYWNAQVRADLLTGKAVWLGHGADFTDTLVSIESMGGSAFNDILLGNDGANTLYGVYFSPSGSGDDILAGRGGDDTLLGMDGNDILLGGRGADSLSGGEGNDLLIDAADGWGANNQNPGAYGAEGNDLFVFMLGAAGDVVRGNFMDGGTGADTYIIDPAQGLWGSLGLQFSQIDGDRLDLSALRTATGNVLTLDYVRSTASTPFYGSTTLDLSAYQDAAGHALSGRIVLNSVFTPSDLHAEDFIFAGGENWRSHVPTDLMGLI